jgi:branched-subunit amino acid transport protein
MQLNVEQERFFRAMLTNMRILSAALISGVVVFLVVVLFIIKSDPKPGLPLLTYLGLAFGAVAVVFAFIIPGFIGGTIKQALVDGKRVDLPPQFKTSQEVGIAGNLLFLFQTRLIIGYAILEGAAFFNLVAYMLERQDVSLAVVGLLLGAMMAKFPTRGKVAGWLADETRAIAELRSLKPNRR